MTTSWRRVLKSSALLMDETFMAMLAHELRNPLAPITNALQVIHQAAPESALVKNALEILERQVRCITDLVSDLVDLTTDTIPLNKDEVNLCSLVGERLEAEKPTFAARKINLKQVLPEEGVWVIGDQERLNNVLGHLLRNAAKLTESGGKVSVTLNYGEKEVFFNVRDDGAGMNRGDVEKIFNIASEKTHRGIGASLTLAREIAFLHGGTIEAHSDGIGKGSELLLILPLLKVTEKFAEEVLVQKSENRCLEILVVDDHPDAAESLATLLRTWGHKIYIAHSGINGYELSKIHEPEAAILDIALPDIDGYQLARKIKEDLPNTNLIALTGHGLPIDKKLSAAAGFWHHLVKPVVPEQLKEVLTKKSLPKT